MGKYVCPICDDSYTYADGLAHHLALRHLEKRKLDQDKRHLSATFYSGCPLCSTLTGSSDPVPNMTRHIKLHLNNGKAAHKLYLIRQLNLNKRN